MAESKKKKKLGRPATGQMPKRYFRMGDEEYAQVISAAKASGQSISDLIRNAALAKAKSILKSNGGGRGS